MTLDILTQEKLRQLLTYDPTTGNFVWLVNRRSKVKAGAIAGVSVDYVKLGQQTAEVVRDVLDGVEPRSIPRITLSGDKLIVNKTAADRWGFRIPQSVLDRADEVVGGGKGD